MTQGPCPTPQTSPNYITMNVATAPASYGNLGNPPGQKKNTLQMACMSQETTTQGGIYKQWHLHGEWRRE